MNKLTQLSELNKFISIGSIHGIISTEWIQFNANFATNQSERTSNHFCMKNFE